MKAKVAATAESEKKGGGKLENEDLNSVDICYHSVAYFGSKTKVGKGKLSSQADIFPKIKRFSRQKKSLTLELVFQTWSN